MNTRLFAGALLASTALGLTMAHAQEAVDITQTKGLVGPGTISLMTKGDTMFSVGGLARLIPTVEDNWSFGAADSGAGGNVEALDSHVNESGWVQDDYFRSEARVYFNALPKDQSWSFSTALEFDRPLETATVDERGGKLDTSSDFGMERLLGSVALPAGHRLYAGWDVWGIDMSEAQGFVYADDNPGAWLRGSFGPMDYSVGYWKLAEFDFQNAPILPGTSDDDRDLYGGYADWKFAPGQKIRAFYLFDNIDNARITTTARALGGQGAPAIGFSDASSHHAGAYWTGKFGNLSVMGEGVYQFGEAEATGLARSSYDINAYALAGDASYELQDIVGIGFAPRIGFLYTSGDESAADDELGGYTSVTDFSRFSKWGGEGLITSDTNFVLGTPLYGFLPEGLGNGTPIVTGGLQNLAGAGFGRGDNPGASMISVGLTVKPLKDVTYITNLNSFWWNEDQVVASWVDGTQTQVDAGYVGTEWSNEIVWKVNAAFTLRGQASVFRPGDAVKEATAALTARGGTPGRESDDLATRFAAELVWAF